MELESLSTTGKVTLINSVLNALPIYLLSFIKLPQRIADRLVSLQRNFMWGGEHDQKKIPWVKWDVICLNKKEGGLGIKNLPKFNAALMGRWIWDLYSNQNQFWVRVLNSKYGGWSALQNGKVHCWDSQWWRDLRKLYQQNDLLIFQGIPFVSSKVMDDALFLAWSCLKLEIKILISLLIIDLPTLWRPLLNLGCFCLLVGLCVGF